MMSVAYYKVTISKQLLYKLGVIQLINNYATCRFSLLHRLHTIDSPSPGVYAVAMHFANPSSVAHARYKVLPASERCRLE